jgi:hypothetical protein
VLRRIFRRKGEEVAGGWRKIHNEELHNLHASSNIIRVIKSRKMRCAGYVERMGEPGNAYNILVREPEGKRPLGRPQRRWSIILEYILLKYGSKLCTGFIFFQDRVC